MNIDTFTTKNLRISSAEDSPDIVQVVLQIIKLVRVAMLSVPFSCGTQNQFTVMIQICLL